MVKFIIKGLFSGLLVVAFSANAAIHTIQGDPTQSFKVLGGADVVPPGSQFVMFSPIVSGVGVVLLNPDSPAEYATVGTTEDLTGSLDDSQICFDISCTNVNFMTFSTNIDFSGAPWTAHTIRLFGQGTYQIQTCPSPSDGSTTCTPGAPEHIQALTVGPGQLGAQVFFDWSGNANIDVILVWDMNAVVFRPAQFSGLIPADTRVFELASRDVSGDGNAGSAMLDGPFGGHNASFSFFLDTPLAIPATPTMVISQPGNPGAATGVIDTAGAAVTIDSGIAAAGSLTFDWNFTNTPTTPKNADTSDMFPTSDAALVTANTNGTASPTFEFNPGDAAIIPGATLTVSVKVTNTTNGLSNGATFDLVMGCPAASAPGGQDTDGDGTDDNVELCVDSDSDGILEYLDPSTHALTEVSVDLPTGTVATSDTGAFSIGTLAASVIDTNGNQGSGIGIAAADISLVDNAVIQSCVGGCFDFVVSGGALGGTGTSVNVVLPLSAPVPDRAVYKKFDGSSWGLFDDTAALDSVNSAASVASVCPAPGDAAYSSGLVAGDDCLQVSIEDNGPNDANSSDGTVADPGGIGQLPLAVVNSAPTAEVEGVFGCSATQTPLKWTERGELLLIIAFITWLGLLRRRKA